MKKDKEKKVMKEEEIKEEEKEIKEERISRTDNIEDPFADIRVDKPINTDFENRTSQFWDDIDGIIALLNRTDPKHTNTILNSPQVNHYLMWRILSEIKNMKVEQKKVSDIINKNEEMYSRKPNKFR